MKSNGAVLLPMVMMISAIVLTIGMAGLMVGVVLSRSISSMRMSERALTAARAGIDDARRRIARDPQWAPVCASVIADPATYSLSLGTASVDVCALKTVTGFALQAMGASQGFRRRVDAEIGVDARTDAVRLISSYEVPL